MSQANERTQYFQEQSIPELRELERKKIFTTHEIRSIASRRSMFEHKVNARGAEPADFARYADFEMNLDNLRRVRSKRIGAKSLHYSGQRRIFFILDRAAKRFPGDLATWQRYLSFAHKHQSHKRISEILTRILRLHSTKAELWIFAANYALDERSDIVEARSYMQRGIRFCEMDRRIWLEYARLEILYIAKISARRRILGLDTESSSEKSLENTKQIALEDSDEIRLPVVTAGELEDEPGTKPLEGDIADRLSSGPAMLGAVPKAVFDAAVKKKGFGQEFAAEFFDTVAEFEGLACAQPLLDHTIEVARKFSSDDPEILLRYIRQPSISIPNRVAEYPAALQQCLSRLEEIQESIGEGSSKARLGALLLRWMLSITDEKDLDADIVRALEITMKRVWRSFIQANDRSALESVQNDVELLRQQLEESRGIIL